MGLLDKGEAARPETITFDVVKAAIERGELSHADLMALTLEAADHENMVLAQRMSPPPHEMFLIQAREQIRGLNDRARLVEFRLRRAIGSQSRL